MFRSNGFKESLDVTDGEPGEKEKEDLLEVEAEDSDNDRDMTLRQNLPETWEPHKLKELPIRHACYTTYRALLFYLYSGKIEFAVLKSNSKAQEVCAIAENKPTNAHCMVDRLPEEHSDPLLTTPAVTSKESFIELKQLCLKVSPKSMYKLAHAYDIQPLKDLALQSIVAQLTPDNILLEVTSVFAATYDEVRAKEVTYWVNNWQKVRQSPVHDHFKVTPGFVDYGLFIETMSEVERGKGRRSPRRRNPDLLNA
ncbi:hypothetical protein BT69DRAFT_1285924 [Atractiella rhizophila]|nr:hypothetical protein BT69DRAFT_1285924 [Atractiella rhizophila]